MIKTDGSIYKIEIPVKPNELNLLTDTMVSQFIKGTFYKEDSIMLDKISFITKRETSIALLLWNNDANSVVEGINWRARQIVDCYSSYISPISVFVGDCVAAFYSVK